MGEEEIRFLRNECSNKNGIIENLMEIIKSQQNTIRQQQQQEQCRMKMNTLHCSGSRVSRRDDEHGDLKNETIDTGICRDFDDTRSTIDTNIFESNVSSSSNNNNNNNKSRRNSKNNNNNSNN